MEKLKRLKKLKKLNVLLLPILTAIFNLLIIFYPKQVIEASSNGVQLWFDNVLPVLLPFLIGVNILVLSNFVDLIGMIFEPFMYKFFGTPGVSSLALICGLLSGYPVGIKIVSELRQKNLISKIDAERLSAFTNNSGPLFIVGFIGSGLLKNIKLGYFILFIHYISAISTGLLFKYYKKSSAFESNSTTFSLKKLYYKLSKQPKVSSSFIISSSVKNSMETIVFIGGFIILFSVLIKILEVTNLMSYIALFFQKLNFFGISTKYIEGTLFGILEITNGLSNLVQNSKIDNLLICFICFIVSFGGFCIHMQAMSFISKTDIHLLPYFIGKFTHAILAFLYCLILYPFWNFIPDESMSVFSTFEYSFTKKVYMPTILFISILVISVLLFLIIKYFSRISSKHK